jgi:hypothetical protein
MNINIIKIKFYKWGIIVTVKKMKTIANMEENNLIEEFLMMM